MLQVWNVTRDIASFPTISSSYAITLVFNPGVAALGNALILLTPINCADLPGNCNTDAYYINPIKRFVLALCERIFTTIQYSFLLNFPLYNFLVFSIPGQKSSLDLFQD